MQSISYIESMQNLCSMCIECEFICNLYTIQRCRTFVISIQSVSSHGIYILYKLYVESLQYLYRGYVESSQYLCKVQVESLQYLYRVYMELYALHRANVETIKSLYIILSLCRILQYLHRVYLCSIYIECIEPIESTQTQCRSYRAILLVSIQSLHVAYMFYMPVQKL